MDFYLFFPYIRVPYQVFYPYKERKIKKKIEIICLWWMSQETFIQIFISFYWLIN